MARKKLSGTPEYRQAERLMKDGSFALGEDNKMGSRERRRSEERKRARAARKKKRQARRRNDNI